MADAMEVFVTAASAIWDLVLHTVNPSGARGFYAVMAYLNAAGLLVSAAAAPQVIRFAAWGLAHEDCYQFTRWADMPGQVQGMLRDWRLPAADQAYSTDYVDCGYVFCRYYEVLGSPPITLRASAS